MPKRKTIEAIEEITSPYALIVSDNHQEITLQLTKILTTRGCQVKTITSHEPLHGEKFDYIFQINDLTSASNLFNKNLGLHGKFLFIEIDQDELSKNYDLPFKVLRIGDSHVWQTKELGDKILRTIFSVASTQIVDARKKPVIATKIPKIVKPVAPPPYQPQIIKKRTRLNKLAIFLLASLVLIGSLVGYLYWSFTSVKKNVTSLQTHISNSNWSEVKKDLKNVKKSVSTLETLYDFSWSVFLPLRQLSVVKDTGVFLALINNILATSQELITEYEKNNAEISPQVLIRSEKNIMLLAQAVSEGRERLKSLSLPYLDKKESVTFFNLVTEKLTATRDLLPVVKKLFFTASPKTYLLLFQNNMELRPTGGFIGSFGLLTVKDGEMLDLKIMDVYTADGQLKGHVEPPQPIRKYLSQPNWFLRDSNFDPDFAKSGATASWFIQKELGHSVDGVIGINLFFVQNLLRVIGPLKLADFNNEVITSDNFFFKAQFYAQEEFFEGSTQKRDFLTSLANSLQLRIANTSDIPIFDLIGVVKKALDEKNLLLASFDEESKSLIEEKGWGGRIVNISCVGISEACKADYLMLNEANLGVNKVNYFVTKSVNIEKKIETDGTLLTTLTISYENRNVAEILAGGTYTNYLRLYLPKNAKLSGMTLNTVPISPTELEIETYGEDKTSYGYLLKIAPENKAVVKFSFSLSQFIDSRTYNYQFFFQKQAGDKVSPLVLSLNLPIGVKLMPLNFKSGSSDDRELIFTTDTSVDRIFALKREQ